MVAQAFGNAVSQRPARVEAFYRALKDHLHVLINLPQFSSRGAGNVFPLEDDAAGGDIQQSGHHVRHRCLAAAAFPDDGQFFSFGNRKGHVIDGQKIIAIGRGKGFMEMFCP